ncbi:hypothetical protein QE152_g30040 [Popillia japonica]|uniref:Uncharacterized protein n=1 Tax=Popillia japonica TaxID=7064 RepID=A0AAW1JFT0_POPJA
MRDGRRKTNYPPHRVLPNSCSDRNQSYPKDDSRRTVKTLDRIVCDLWCSSSFTAFDGNNLYYEAYRMITLRKL